jgi:hypothetical protein
MNVYQLPIEEGMKLKLSSLIDEFNKYRISKGNQHLNLEKVEMTKEEKKTIQEKKVGFFERFFFSEFDKAS